MRVLKKSGWLMTLFVCLLFCMPMVKANAENVVIVLDPGHGGTEAGAYRKWNGIEYKEEVLNMKIANYCKAELETYEGVTVYLTRSSLKQANQDRETRINIAKIRKANALVSIHNNSTGASSQTNLSGVFCCVPSKSKYPDSKSATAKEARNLATAIMKELHSQVGLRNNGFWYDDELGIILFGQKSNYTSAQAQKLGISKSILNTKVPSLIVEHCFVNNPNDCKNYLKTESQLKKLGVADAAGIAKFYGLKKKGAAAQEPENTGSDPSDVKRGIVQVGNALYLYDQNGKVMTGLVKHANHYYYTSKTGKVYTGWKTINGKKYYFDRTTGVAKTGWQKIGKYKYYFSSKGVMQKKWVTIKNKRYYFSKVNGRLLTNYWLKYNNKWYYLNKNGTPYLNCTKTIKGKKYKFDKKGVCTNK